VAPPGHPALFVNHAGAPIAPARLTQLMRRYVDHAGLGKTGACHVFRHTMATLMLEGGADVRLIQEILGHAELSTTEIYTRVNIKHLKAVHTATHPGANLPGRPRPFEPAARELTGEDILAILDAEARRDEPGGR
jgi:integrase/recombinase XerD